MRVIIKGNGQTKIAHEVSKVMVTPYCNRCLIQFNLGKTPKVFAYEGDANSVLYSDILDLTLSGFKETTIEEFTDNSKSFDEFIVLACSFPAIYGVDTYRQLLCSLGLSLVDADFLYHFPHRIQDDVDYDLIVKELKRHIERHPITFQDLRKFVFEHVKPEKDYGETVTEAITAILSNDGVKFESLNISALEVVSKIMGN